jgi:hypothetical protein
MYSIYRVDRAGELRTIDVIFDFDVASESKLLRMENIHAELRGRVQEGIFHSEYHIQAPDGRVVHLHGQEVKLPPHQSVLLPMHLVDRIRDLKPGQQWRLPLINPFVNSLPQGGLFGTKATSTVTVRVLDSAQPFPGHPSISCLILEYQDEDQHPNRIWVDAATDRVLRQEGIINDVKFIIQRESVLQSE